MEIDLIWPVSINFSVYKTTPGHHIRRSFGFDARNFLLSFNLRTAIGTGRRPRLARS
jgi:hypothetical protein